MTNLENIKAKIKDFYQDHGQNLGEVRRDIIIEDMKSQEGQGFDCHSCPGFCCTYQYNSMMITPLEAFEILINLNFDNRITDELVKKLNNNAVSFRLDKEIWQKNTLLRRYYTCPFYKDEKLGCSLSVKLKPLGCLAFNSTEKEVSTTGKCETRPNVLTRQGKRNKGDFIILNKKIKKIFNIVWDKKPISTALLDFLT